MSPLIAAYRDPARVCALGPEAWNRLLREARAHDLLARLGYLLEDHGLRERVPAVAWDLLDGARYYPRLLQAQVRVEIRKVVKALDGLGCEVMLLKGAAYTLAGLKVARGRPLADLDIMVPHGRIAEVEAVLIRAGWVARKVDAYDQRYYREWMHEIPPLVHPFRGVELDVHHRILPLTSRRQPDPALLWRNAMALDDAGLCVPSPTDMVLHCAAHLFQDEIRGRLKELVDFHALVTELRLEPGFWGGLLDRAAALDLGRPLYHALDMAHRLLATPIPPEVLGAGTRRFGPPAPIRVVQRALMGLALSPSEGWAPGTALAGWVLYARSHWLRMPPALLASHLGRKAWRQLSGGGAGRVV